MHPLLSTLVDGVALRGDLHADVPLFLTHHGHPNTALHCADVATEARRVATVAGADPALAEQAGWLHDVSAVFPSPDRARIARQLGIDVLPEEDAFPMIVHQKLSALMAEQIFGISERLILDAIGCHTTLRADATMLDKVVFVADKLAWDQPGIAPYHSDLAAALEQSLDHAVMVYLNYLWERRASLSVIHPWLREAYLQLSVLDI